MKRQQKQYPYPNALCLAKHKSPRVDTTMAAIREFGSLMEMGATADLPLVTISVLSDRFAHQYPHPSCKCVF